MFIKMKALQEELEFLELQENFIRSEQQALKREMIRAKEELKKIQSVPLTIGQFVEMVDENYGIVQSAHGTLYMVRVLSTLDRELLKPNQSVALHKNSQAVVDILPTEADVNVQMLKVNGGANVRFSDIGGLDV